MFFHIVPKLIQTPVITYNEIFQALAVEGDISLPKPFMDLGFDSVVRRTRKSLASEMIFQFAKHLQCW
jgi:hypothetical protein